MLGSLGTCPGKGCAGEHNKGLQEMPVRQQEFRWGKDDLRLHRRYGIQKAMQTGRLPGSRCIQAQGERQEKTAKRIGGNMLQQLYSIQEIGILLLEISGFLFALLVMWIIILAGVELFRDRMNTRTEDKHKEMEILKEKIQEEARKKELERIEAVYDMKIRSVKSINRHLKLKENNYRKMHGLPLIRRRRNHECKRKPDNNL